MRFGDAAIVRLSDPDARLGVFDALAAEHILSAAYDTSRLEVEGPFSTDITSVAAPEIPHPPLPVTGTWTTTPGSDTTTARFDVTWPRPAQAGADLVWQGAVIARSSTATSTVIGVRSAWPALADLDAAGAVPGDDPVALEAARREVLLQRLRAQASDPAVVDDRLMDRMLAAAGARSVADLATRYRADTATAAVQVSFSEPAGPPPSPRRFDVTCAVVVDDGLGAVEVLRRARAAQATLRERYDGPAEPGRTRRQPVTVTWLVAAEAFDDADWPGASSGDSAPAARLARRVAAARWLAPQGIAVVPID